MKRDILAIDVGTTAFKIGVFSPDLEKRCEASREYEINLYDRGKADIEPEKWWQALKDCCHEIKPYLSEVGVVSFSVTTPGLVPMGEDGTALGPAILMLDGRSHKQATEMRQRIGEEKFLEETCNLPVSGGSSLCSILWIRENQPNVWKRTAKFGHCNTYMVKRFTGEWVIDPSTTSITGLYNTAPHDLTWNRDVLSIAEIPEDRLPPLKQSYHKVGRILPRIAAELSLPEDCDVLCGGNDAVLAALSGGFTAPGDINFICGTCEITNVCVDRPVSSRNFNIRCHVIPDRWVTFFVLNTGGLALEWFHSVFCREMTIDQFYTDYIPMVLESFLHGDDPESQEAGLPEYVPFLQGCRYSLEQLTASFSGLTLETTREKILLGLIKGNAIYHREHLKEVAGLVKLSRTVMTTGGGAKIRGFLEAKKRWTGDLEFRYQDQSSLLGAAMLGQFYQRRIYV
ncbi:MAG TPA: FGGY family carbohydrate kinase [Thermodesulfobacteriota bacterium]|nr:FGGY family carbohydrate kinase [Thermodesulfobacteriota bacterium]